MPYYHLRIRQTNRRRPIYLFDYSKKKLEEFIAKARTNSLIILDGWITDMIDPSLITDIEIAKTKVKAENFGIGLMKGQNIFNEAENVTSQFIKKPIGLVTSQKIAPSEVSTLSKNVFIVHGRDTKPLKELKTMLKEFGLNPIVLHEQPSGSRTIVEKLEKYSDVGYAFIVLTPDELGCLKKRYINVYNVSLTKEGESENTRKGNLEFFYQNVQGMLRNRARQNVILEFGFFMGMLGRDRVCCLHKGDVELPSDMHGIVYIPFEDSVNEVKNKIIKELNEAGYKIKV